MSGMEMTGFQGHRVHRWALWTMALLIVSAITGPTDRIWAGEAPLAPGALDFSPGIQQYPNDDAIILRWDQSWAWDSDGTAHRRDHKWIKLLNSRPIRTAADPRIDYHAKEDQLIVHKAQTTLSDGRAIPVPPYAINETSPDDVAGWPVFADWRQRVVSFSGIEDNCVLELDYEIVTKAGVLPWLSADLRLDDEYPIIERRVMVSLPKAQTLSYRVTHCTQAEKAQEQSQDTVQTYLWVFRDLPGQPLESQSPPWTQFCPRLRFTTCPSPSDWLKTINRNVVCPPQTAPVIQHFVDALVEGESNSNERIQRVVKKMQASFNFIASPSVMRSYRCRDIEQVFNSNYGNSVESAALLQQMLQCLGLRSRVYYAVNGDSWDDQYAPTDAEWAGAVVVVDVTGAGNDAEQGSDMAGVSSSELSQSRRLIVHPQLGILSNPGSWGEHVLLGAGESKPVDVIRVYRQGEVTPSGFDLSGRLTVLSDGKISGELHLEFTGGFCDPNQLAKADQQKTTVQQMVNRVLPGLEVKQLSLSTLNDQRVSVDLTVQSVEAVPSLSGSLLIGLGDGPAFLQTYPMPLASSYRRTPVWIGGRIHEVVDLTWSIEGGRKSPTPSTVVHANLRAPWGMVFQQVDHLDKTIVFKRRIDLAVDTLSLNDFLQIREIINSLRSPQKRQLVLDAS